MNLKIDKTPFSTELDEYLADAFQLASRGFGDSTDSWKVKRLEEKIQKDRRLLRTEKISAKQANCTVYPSSSKYCSPGNFCTLRNIFCTLVIADFRAQSNLVHSKQLVVIGQCRVHRSMLYNIPKKV